MAAVDQTARPYVEKVTSTTRPYTDAAFGKAQELVEKMEVGHPTTSPYSQMVGEG